MDSAVTGGTNTANVADDGLLSIIVKLPNLMRVEIATIGRCCATVTTSRLGIYEYPLPDGGPGSSL
jgi:hypothetical protein